MLEKYFKVMTYISYYTWHVVDGWTCQPAKITKEQIKKKFPHLMLSVILDNLKDKKYITGYSFGDSSEGIRATATGSAKVPQKEQIKYYLYEDQDGSPILMNKEQWMQTFPKSNCVSGAITFYSSKPIWKYLRKYLIKKQIRKMKKDV